jgi:5-formyltetrahydrofolate cyclo-ligase
VALGNGITTCDAATTPMAILRIGPKAQLRKRYKRVRREAHAAAEGAGGGRLWRRFSRRPDLIARPTDIIAAFTPRSDTEIDPVRVIAGPAKSGGAARRGRSRPTDHSCFRRWQAQSVDARRCHGDSRSLCPQPQPCEPDVLLVPSLATDEAGYRLGYGGGYYDRTLAELRAGTGHASRSAVVSTRSSGSRRCRATSSTSRWTGSCRRTG